MRMVVLPVFIRGNSNYILLKYKKSWKTSYQ